MASIDHGGGVLARQCDRWARAVAVCVVLATVAPASIEAQDALPFGLRADDLSRVDSRVMRWASVRSYPGGVEAEARYPREAPTVRECRAVALVAGGRLREAYANERDDRLVALRLRFLCGPEHRGVLLYDGVNTHLEIKDATTGRSVYRGRHRGPPPFR